MSGGGLALGLTLGSQGGVGGINLPEGTFLTPGFSDADSFGALTIAAVAAQEVSFPEFTDADTIHALTVAKTTPQTLTFGEFAHANTFPALIVGPESQDFFPPEFDDADSFGALTLASVSVQSFTVGEFADSDSFGALELSLESFSALTMPEFTDADSFGALEVTYAIEFGYGDGGDLEMTTTADEFSVTLTGSAAQDGTYGPYQKSDLVAGPLPVVPIVIVASDGTNDGSVLTAYAAWWAWDGTVPSITRQWYRDDVAISGETGDTYTLAYPADNGATIECRETDSVGSRTSSDEVVVPVTMSLTMTSDGFSGDVVPPLTSQSLTMTSEGFS